MNVIVSWLSYIVFFSTGFIIPRMIDNYIGQVNLGIWDFSWSLVNSFNFLGLGIGSSINRYVAKYRAQKDIIGLRQTVSSVMCIQVAIALIMLILTVVISSSLPMLFSDKLGPHINETRWVILLLGSSLVVQMGFNVFHGILTGCHRFDIVLLQSELENSSSRVNE